MSALLVEFGLKSAAIVAITLAVLSTLKNRPAAERSFLAHVGLIAVLLLPPLSLLGPPLELEVLAAQPAPTPIGSDLTALASVTEAPEPSAAVSPAQILTLLYFLIAALLGSALVAALLRLTDLRTNSSPVADTRWLAAVAHIAKDHHAIRRPELRASDAISSPISWGLFRPVIVLDRRTLAVPEAAEPVLLHELAHIRSLDWLMLVLERLATALFWFNPLVWVLAHESRKMREQAADDAVLRATVRPTDYALLLVEAARREVRPAPLLANGIAPQPGALEERITNVLDNHLDRRPLGKAAAASCCALALAIHAPVAAMQLTSPVAPKAMVAPAPSAPAPVAAVLAAPKTAAPSSPAMIQTASLAVQPQTGGTIISGQIISQDGLVIEHDARTGRVTRRPATPAERAALRQAKIELERARPQMEAARRELERARPEIEAARRAIEQARPEIEKGRVEIERSRAVMAAARAEIERARPQLEAAKAELERAKPELEAARVKLARIRAAQARGEPPANVAGPGERIEVLPSGAIVIHDDN